MATGALSVALLSAGTTGAFAADASPSHHASPSRHQSSPSHQAAPSGQHPVGANNASYRRWSPSLSVRATPNVVWRGQHVRITGHASGLRAGTPVFLQQEERGGKWITLHSYGRVDRYDNFSITEWPGNGYGHHYYRVVSGRYHSPTVSVNVR